MKQEWGCTSSYRKKRHALNSDPVVPYIITVRGEQVSMAFDAFLGYLLDENKELISVQDLVTYPMPTMFSADDNAEAGQSEFAYERLHQSMQNFAYDYHRRTQDPRIRAEMKETGWHDRGGDR